jgi:hypothetical protein
VLPWYVFWRLLFPFRSSPRLKAVLRVPVQAPVVERAPPVQEQEQGPEPEPRALVREQALPVRQGPVPPQEQALLLGSVLER